MIVPPLKGLNKCVPMINPGLTPWAMQEYRPLGAHCPTATINPTNNTIKQIHERTQQSIYTPQTHLTNIIPRHNTANAQYDKEPCKGDTPAKPRVK